METEQTKTDKESYIISKEEELRQEILRLEKKYALMLSSMIDKKMDNDRLAELEIKMAKLWDLLTEKTPTGREKVSKFGKGFKERFKR